MAGGKAHLGYYVLNLLRMEEVFSNTQEGVEVDMDLSRGRTAEKMATMVRIPTFKRANKAASAHHAVKC